MDVSGSSPWAWYDVQCWAESFSSLCSLWWGRAGCHSGAPSQSGLSWWTRGSLHSAECWMHKQIQKSLTWEMYCTSESGCVFVCVREHDMCVWLPEVLAQGRRVVGQQCVDQTKQLHHSLILPQVLVALQQEHELVAVTACRGRHKMQHSYAAYSEWRHYVRDILWLDLAGLAVFSMVLPRRSAAASPLPSPEAMSAEFEQAINNFIWTTSLLQRRFVSIISLSMVTNCLEWHPTTPDTKKGIPLVVCAAN